MKQLEFHIKEMITLLNVEFSKEIESCVKKALEEKLKSFCQDDSANRLITTPELQKLLSLSKSSINSLKQSGMPYLKISGNVRFNVKHVMHFMKQFEKRIEVNQTPL